MKKPFNLFFAIIAITIVFSVAYNDIKEQAHFLKTGVEPPYYPQPVGTINRIDTPGISLGMQVPRNQEDPVGSDFVQVYMAAKALNMGKSAYKIGEAGMIDPWGRVSAYPPLIHWVYQPLARLQYPTALLLHDFLTLGIFMLLSMLILLQTGFIRSAWKVLVIFLLLYFYTPVGLSHFEKGQFDFFTAGTHLFPAVVFMGTGGLPYFFTSGFLAGFKWSSFPFIGSFCAFGFLASTGRKRWLYLIPLVVIALTILIFWKQFLEYLPSLQYFEFSDSNIPTGYSFQHLMPRMLAKSFQIITLGLFCLFTLYFSRKTNKRQLLEVVSLPFALAMAAQGLGYGTLANEYRVVSLLGLVVPFLLWLEKSTAPYKIKMLMAASFGIFLVEVFRNFEFLVIPSDSVQALVLLIASLFWMGVSLYLVFIHRKDSPEMVLSPA